MITRMIYRAEWQEGQVSTGVKALERSEQAKQRIEQGELMTAAAYVWNNSLFLYYECMDCMLSPDEIAGAAIPYLKDWPGRSESRKWIQMIDVFHFNERRITSTGCARNR